VDALNDAMGMDYRKESAKVVVLIADAPPHGLGCMGDGFPKECPCQLDPLEVSRKMAERGIVIYSVGVEPSIGQYSYARELMMCLAKKTAGQFLPLTSAKLLVDAIVGGAVEELSLNSLIQEVVEEAKRINSNKQLSEKELREKITEKLHSKNVVTNQLKVDDIYGGQVDTTNVEILVAAKNLPEARSLLKPPRADPSNKFLDSSPYCTTPSLPSCDALHAPVAPSFFARLKKSIYSPSTDSSSSSTSVSPMMAPPPSGYSGEQTVSYGASAVTYEQVDRMVSKCENMGLL